MDSGFGYFVFITIFFALLFIGLGVQEISKSLEAIKVILLEKGKI